MKVLFGCPWWGLDQLGTEKMLETIVKWGYDAVETGIPQSERDQITLRKALKDTGLKLIAHQYQAEGERVEDYLDSLKKWLNISAELNPLYINSHSGRDYWSFSDNSKVVELCLDFEKDSGLTIAHETHRGRFLYSAPASLEYFRKYPELKINADLSHWVCVSESLLENHQEALEEALKRAEYIHARVGHEQGSQISHPESSQWNAQVTAHLSWWQDILKKKEHENRENFVITPEFGPRPYMWTHPINGEPIAKHTDINLIMRDIIKDKILRKREMK